MKKQLMLIVLLAALCLPARAETTYYTLNEDMYYHLRPVCASAADMVPVSGAAAEEFGKYPCPVCGPVKQNVSAKSLVRGGTIVSRIPQSWLDDPAKTTENLFAAPGQWSYQADEAHARLSELLHGEYYTDFISEYDANGVAKTTVRVPDIIWDREELIMNERHFGGVYYIVFRPKIQFEDFYTTTARLFEHELTLENDTLRDYVDQEWHKPDFRIDLDRISGGNAVFDSENGSLKTTVFREMDTNIAVITEKGADPNYISGVKLNIGGLYTGIEITGYMDGADAVFCCVLTDAELDRLKNGAAAEISREEIFEKLDFQDTPYAIVKAGDVCGLVNSEMEFVLDAKYDGIHRTPLDHVFVASEKNTYYKLIYDAAEDREIAYLDADDYYPHRSGEYVPQVQNRAVFTLRTGDTNKIFDMRTGKLISTLDWKATGSLNGVFLGPVFGNPDRLVSETESMRLIDLQGNFCSGSYAQIIPLIWNGGKGLFLTANMEGEYGDSVIRGGTDWRCGVIDENGKVLAEMEYVSAVILSGTNVLLRDASGAQFAVELAQ